MGSFRIVIAILAGGAVLAGSLYMTSSLRRLRAALLARTQEGQKAAEMLRFAHAYLSNIVELSDDAIISVDTARAISLFSLGAERIFGYRASEVLGKPLDLLLPPRFHAAHRRHVERFAASPDAMRPMNERQTLVGLRKDGTEFPLEAAISKFETQGATVLTVRLRDMTEPRRAEEALKLFAAIVRSSDDAIIGKTVDGTILSWNGGAERLYGYPADEIVGRSISVLVPPEHLDRLRGVLERVRRGEHITHFETVRKRKDGALVDVSLSLSPIKDPTGQTVGLAAIERDITARKQLEAQLRQAQKMEAIGTLAGGIAHDFNNILNAVIGHAELLGDDLAEASRGADHLQEILVAGTRAKELVRQILTFSRRTERERRPVALRDIVPEAMRLLRASLPTTVEFRQQLEPGRALVLADPIQLHQVLLNLCTNAEHAMREQGGLLDVQLKTVEVDAEFAAAHPPLTPGSYVKLTVRDTGHGMPRKVRERIFDPFFTTKPLGEGTGMGLAVVHGIVTDHDGTITVESAPGTGTRFDVYLPRCDAAEPPEIPLERPIRGHLERILLVDDEPSLVRLWTAMLEQLGYRVTAYTNSQHALEAFRAAPQTVDLVISDQTMPQLTGEAFARELLRLRPDLPLILCTGFSHSLTEEKAKTLGIRALLQKPIGRQELCVTVQRLLAERAIRTL